MHASTVAVAIIALNAASAMAGPMSDNIHYRRDSAAVKADAASGSTPTVTHTYYPKATECKPGETPFVKHHETSKAGAAHQDVKRRSDAPAPTPAPTGTGTEHAHKEGRKRVPHTVTKAGSDGKTTVKVYVPSTSTPCHAPKGTAGAEKLAGTEKKHTGDSAAAKPDAQAHVAARSDAATPAPTAASGSTPTITHTYYPKATECKPGETPFVKHHKTSKAGAAHEDVKRRSDAPAPTPAPTGTGTEHAHKEGRKRVPHTVTKAGSDGKTTVKVYVPSTSTPCHAPKGTAGAEKLAGTEKHTGDSAAAKPDAQAHVAARSDAATPAPTAASGSTPTITHTYYPKATECKPGETPFVKHHKTSKAGAAHEDVKRRSDAPAPTPAPTGTGTEHAHKEGQKRVPHTVTKAGSDGKTTVKVYVPSTSTPCHAPKGTAGAEKLAGTEKKHTADSAATKADTQAPVSDSKKVARAIELLERYFGDLDELD